MRREQLEGKLTQAAEQVLDEIVKDYRTQVLLGAEGSAAEYSGEVKEIAVHDVLKSMRELGGQPRRSPPSTVKTLTRWYRAIGITLMVSGCAYLVYLIGLHPASKFSLLAAGGAAGGVFFTVLSEAVLSAYRSGLLGARRGVNSVLSRSKYAQLYLSYWSNLETMMRDIVSSEYGESIAHGPLSMLARKGMIRKVMGEDEGLFLKLLTLRNEITHGVGRVSDDDMRRGIIESERLVQKLGSLNRAGGMP